MIELDMGQSRVCVEIRLHTIRFLKEVLCACEEDGVYSGGSGIRKTSQMSEESLCFRRGRWHAGSGDTALCPGRGKRAESSGQSGLHREIIK